jgi:branched-subunit amino acid aminotransferase/4-amino-4-deoxychorismate lyase
MRIRSGRALLAERHARRLRRAARDLRIGDLDEAILLRAFDELARAAFAAGDGVLRFQASVDGDGRTHVVGVPRPLEAGRSRWSAIIAPFFHEGFTPYGGRKVSSRLFHALAFQAARDAGADEALLFDAGGWLVEGSRSNLFVADADGELATPPLARGAVRGIARGVLLERVAGIAERDIGRADLAAARELIAVNAVCGARPITVLDGRRVGDGRPGPGCRSLEEAFEKD